MNRKLFTTIIALTSLCTAMFAQTQTMQVMKGGAVVFETPASGSEKVVFQNPSGPATPPSNDALFVQVAGAATDTVKLDHIKEIAFSGGNMSVIPLSGATKTYTMSNTKIAFGKGTFTGINSPNVNIDLTAYFTPEGNLVAQCPAGILSMTLFSIDGRIVATEQFDGASVGARLIAPTSPGIYILRVETTQGTISRKIINTKN